MNRTFLLLKTQAVNYFSLNEIFGQHGGKRGPVFITAVGIFTLLLFLGGYNVLTAAALVSMGQQDMIPAYMVAVSSFIILVFTLLRSNGILFGSRDFYAQGLFSRYMVFCFNGCLCFSYWACLFYFYVCISCYIQGRN